VKLQEEGEFMIVDTVGPATEEASTPPTKTMYLIKRPRRLSLENPQLEEILSFYQREISFLENLKDDLPISDTCYKPRGQLRLGVKNNKNEMIDLYGQRISWECNIEGCTKKNGTTWSKIIAHHRTHHPSVHLMEIAIRQAIDIADMIRYTQDGVESVFSRKKILEELRKIVMEIRRRQKKRNAILSNNQSLHDHNYA
jgi:hypothetical protein